MSSAPGAVSSGENEGREGRGAVACGHLSRTRGPQIGGCISPSTEWRKRRSWRRLHERRFLFLERFQTRFVGPARLPASKRKESCASNLNRVQFEIRS